MEKKRKNSVLNIVLVIILITVAVFTYIKFKENNFNEFVKTEYFVHQSNFSRDSNIKYSKNNSYKIESKNFNDAMFYQTIEVQPNTSYRVSCMVKTQDIETEKEVSIAGAHISIADTVEKSKSIVGTNDWQKLEFIFNSKNRTSVKIGFRLGSYEDNAKGTAWFSDFQCEQGTTDDNTQWNVGFFIIENIDTTIEKNGSTQRVKISMSNSDISDMRTNIARFANSCKELSENGMSVKYDTFIVTKPLTTLSKDEENGYFVAPKDVEKLIDSYIQKNEYDHIFVAVRFGDSTQKIEIPVNDWIGLGSMDYYGIGFSNIRLPNNSKSYIYKYEAGLNTFPEEVFIHEFLHSLERTLNEYEYTIPALHDYEKYGYKTEKVTGLKQWYQDYMRKNIKTSDGKIGLEPIVYKLKPVHKRHFNYSYLMKEVFIEPKNILEEIKILLKNLGGKKE